jgi:hypothetical protein
MPEKELGVHTKKLQSIRIKKKMKRDWEKQGGVGIAKAPCAWTGFRHPKQIEDAPHYIGLDPSPEGDGRGSTAAQYP